MTSFLSEKNRMKVTKIAYTIISFISIIVIWELIARFTKASMFLPSASVVLKAFFKSFVEPIGKYTMIFHILISLYRVLPAKLQDELLDSLKNQVDSNSKKKNKLCNKK